MHDPMHATLIQSSSIIDVTSAAAEEVIYHVSILSIRTPYRLYRLSQKVVSP